MQSDCNIQYFHRLVLKKCSLVPNQDANQDINDNNIETVWRR